MLPLLPPLLLQNWPLMARTTAKDLELPKLKLCLVPPLFFFFFFFFCYFANVNIDFSLSLHRNLNSELLLPLLLLLPGPKFPKQSKSSSQPLPNLLLYFHPFSNAQGQRTELLKYALVLLKNTQRQN